MKKRDQRIIERLRRHAELTTAYEADGFSRDEASAKAYKDITGRNSPVAK